MIEKLKLDGEMWIDEDGVSHPSKLAYLEGMVGFCGCGDPTSVLVYVQDMFHKLDSHNWGEYEDMPYMFFVYWANDRNFAEHGTTARCSWLTPLGKELLRDIDECLHEQAANGT